MALAVELFLYGRRGDLEVCVGKEGLTDFALADQPFDEATRAARPHCQTRQNIGLFSVYDEAVEDASIKGCQRLTLFDGREALVQCAAGVPPYEHRIEARHVMPWEPDYYRKLFWFAF